MKQRLFFLIILFTMTQSPACEPYGYPLPCYPCVPVWSALLYYGKMTNDNLGEVMTFNFSTNTDTLYSFEVGKRLDPCNIFVRFFQPLVSSMDVRGNITLLDDRYGLIYELNPYFTFNWHHFPWNHVIYTTVSAGEGFSYASKVPYAEAHNSDQPKKFLNFLLFEVGFALPQHPCWEIIARIHHRSGAYGLYHANNSGSTAIGLALRYRF